MVKIKCPKEYNYWDVLVNAGIEPVHETDKYSYDEETEELTADVTQEELEKAFAKYDHQAWLASIKKPESLEERIEMLEQELAEQKLVLKQAKLTK